MLDEGDLVRVVRLVVFREAHGRLVVLEQHGARVTEVRDAEGPVLALDAPEDCEANAGALLRRLRVIPQRLVDLRQRVFDELLEVARILDGRMLAQFAQNRLQALHYELRDVSSAVPVDHAVRR